jgi:putative ABC transport system substrate-binding protein
VKRRDFITLLGGAAAWPLAARAQQPRMPVIGFMHTASADRFPHVVAAFSKGLKEAGYVDGQNTLLSRDLAPKRLELLHDLVPQATAFAMLVNPNSPDADAQSRDLQTAASAVGMQVRVFRASNDSDIDTAFAAMAERNTNALVVQADPFFTSRRDRLVTLANRQAIAAMYPFREFATIGGLITYGTDIAEIFRGTGVYTGRILNGQRPADLPIL